MTPENEALCQADPQNELRLLMGRDFTPSSREIADWIVWFQRDVIMAEEYDHLTLSREEVLGRAKEKLNLGLRALKQSLIYEIKQQKGEWIAIA